MSKNKNNDNLEQFFKQHLESYSPEPSDGFWARMKTAIPPKPPIWSGWVATAGKWMGASIITAGLITGGLAYWKEHQKVGKLSEQIAAQQLKIEHLVKQNSALQNELQTNDLLENKIELPKPSEVILNKNEYTREGLTNNKKINESNIEHVNLNRNGLPLTSIENSANILGNQNDIYSEATNKQNNKNNDATPQISINENRTVINNAKKEIKESVSSPVTFENNELVINPKLIEKDNENKLNVIPYLSFNPLKNQVNTPSVKTNSNGGYKPSTRFSFEGGASVFIQPMGRLFSDSVSFDPGKTALSTGAGILFNFELNSKWILQGGFYYKNLKTRNVKLGYNVFPLILRRRYAWGLNSHLEIKTGVAMNALVSVVNKEGEDVPGFKKSYLDLLVGAAYVSRIGEKMNLVIEPNFGYSLTAVANRKRSFYFGIYAGIRYKLL